jgi:hypothetical protein
MQDKFKVPRKTKTANKKAKVAKISKPLKNAIQKVINSDIETKFVTGYQSPTTYNGTILTKAEWMYPLPMVYQVGDPASLNSLGNSSNRIGDTIRPLSLKVHITVSLSDLMDETADIYVNLFVFTAKFAKSLEGVQSADTPGAGTFLDTGNGSLGAWLGNTTDLGLPINLRQYTPIKVYRFRLAKGAGHMNEGLFTDATCNGSSTTFRHFVCNIPCPSTLRYSNDTDTLPQNFCPIMAVGYTHMDGTAADSVTQNLRLAYRSNLYFKDA